MLTYLTSIRYMHKLTCCNLVNHQKHNLCIVADNISVSESVSLETPLTHRRNYYGSSHQLQLLYNLCLF